MELECFTKLSTFLVGWELSSRSGHTYVPTVPFIKWGSALLWRSMHMYLTPHFTPVGRYIVPGAFSQCVQSTQTHNLGCIQTSTCGSVHVFYPYKDNRLDTCLCPFMKVHHSHKDFGCGQWTKVDGRTNLLPSIKMTCLSWRSSCATVIIIVIIIITFLSKKRESWVAVWHN